METDAFFCRLFKQLPQTLFQLIGLPAARAKSYRFDSVELKKSFRIDGLFLPKQTTMPLYFVEVQFQRRPTFYANLFAKVFCYLHENDPKQDWGAAAIFASRAEEPKHLTPYEDLLRSKRVKRIYLDEVSTSKNPPVGLGILQLLFAPVKLAEDLAPHVVHRAKTELSDGDLQMKVVELVEELLMSRFPQFGREEIRMKFKLHDLRESKVWKEAYDEGADANAKKFIESLLAKGKTHKEVAELLNIPVDKVERLTKENSN